MASDQSVVTVAGADRQALLTDLTLRFGRVDIIDEREVTLDGGAQGWEVTARHRPFTVAVPDSSADLPNGTSEPEQIPAEPYESEPRPALEPYDDSEERAAAAEIVRDAEERAAASVAGAEATAGALISDAQAKAAAVLADAESRADSVVDEARTDGARLLEEARAEADRIASQARAVLDGAQRKAQQRVAELEQSWEREAGQRQADAEAAGRKILVAAREEANRLRSEIEQELVEARAAVRVMTREARAEADALLREAAAQADLATVEGHTLAAVVREIHQSTRDLGAKLQQQLQTAQEELTEQASIHNVQERLRTGEQPTAESVAEHLARILKLPSHGEAGPHDEGPLSRAPATPAAGDQPV